MGVDHLESLDLPQFVHLRESFVFLLHALDGHSFAGLDVLGLEDLRERAFSFAANEFILC